LNARPRENRLAPVKGLGAALQAKIVQGLAIRRQGKESRHLHRAAALLHSAEAQLRRSKELKRITFLRKARRVAAPATKSPAAQLRGCSSIAAKSAEGEHDHSVESSESPAHTPVVDRPYGFVAVVKA
jgi:hypothetical protein